MDFQTEQIIFWIVISMILMYQLITNILARKKYKELEKKYIWYKLKRNYPNE